MVLVNHLFGLKKKDLISLELNLIKNVELINKKLKKGKCIAGYIEDIQIKDKFEVIMECSL